jgi:hypothetical protein
MRNFKQKMLFGAGAVLAASQASAADYTGLVPDFSGGDAAIIAAGTAVLALLSVVVVFAYVKRASH